MRLKEEATRNKRTASTMEQEVTKPQIRKEDLNTARQKTKEAQGGERKLYHQHACMGCLAPELRHHQVGPVQGLMKKINC